jgi:hypothetical protein
MTAKQMSSWKKLTNHMFQGGEKGAERNSGPFYDIQWSNQMSSWKKLTNHMF